MRRDYIFWGTALILLGGLIFMNNAGVRILGVNPLNLFWPSILILLGLWVILGATFRGSLNAEKVSVDLQGASQASLKLSHGAGSLTLYAGASPGQLLDGQFAGGVKQKVSRSGDRLNVHLEANSVAFPSVIGFGRGLEWNLSLNREIPIALKLETGASQTKLDLRHLKISELKISTGASKTDVTLPASAGETIVQVELGAASMDMIVPDGVAGRIRSESGVASIEINTSRFPYSNGIYESADYSSAKNKVDIMIQAGAGRVAVR